MDKPIPEAVLESAAWEALRQGARSLRTISEQAGKDEYMKDMLDVRCYAASRATIAEAALAQQPAAGAVDEALDRMRHAPPRLWRADLVGQQISAERMRDILAFALATKHQEPKKSKAKA